jgi:2-iminobutanoate/2-iminopropanoate deaminase
VTKTVIARETSNGKSTQAVKGNGLVITTGNIGTDPATGELPPDIETQTRNTLSTLQGVLEQSGSRLDQVMKVNVYLDEIDGEFDRMNGAYKAYFSEQGITDPPARMTIGCRLPWSKVEMDMIALGS